MTAEPTPRTDAALAYGWLSDEFVRQLEREVRSCQQSLVSMHERAENAERELSLAQSRLAEVEDALRWILQADRGSRAFEAALNTARIILASDAIKR